MPEFAATALNPTVNLKIGTLTVPISRVDLRHNIDELPFITFEVQLDSQMMNDAQGSTWGSVSLNVSAFNELNQAIQTKILNDFRLEADTFLEVTDGQGNTLRFKGHLGRPQFGLQNGVVSLNFTAVHLGSNLQAFNPSIYASLQYEAAVQSYNYLEPYSVPGNEPVMPRSIPVYGYQSDQVKMVKQPRTDSLADRLATFAFGLMLDRNNSPPTPAIAFNYNGQAIHNLNRLAWSYLRDTLKLSRDRVVLQGISAGQSVDEGINGKIIDILKTSLNGWDVLRHMQNQFVLQINADWDGPVYMEHSLSLSQPEGRVIQAPMESIQFTMANMFELPLRQAVVHMPMSSLFAFAGTLNQNPNGTNWPTDSSAFGAAALAGYKSIPIFAGYPTLIDNNQAGTYYAISPPDWIGADQFPPETLDELFKSGEYDQVFTAGAPAAPTLPVNPALEEQDITQDRTESTVFAVEMLTKGLAQKQQSRVWLLQYYAQRAFYEYYIGNTQASVSLPLTLNQNLQVGRVYEVRSATPDSTDGNPLFTGYLRSVSHHIGIARGGGEASTVLTFSHVVVTGVKLSALRVNAATANPNLRTLS